MDNDIINNTNSIKQFLSPTFSWCFLLPLIHIFSLISNILCIIVFCSNVFIKKPIAIYFICLLISDSMVLLIGYIEMMDRESSMIDKSSWLCIFNGNVIHRLSDFLYTFMGRFCLEWMLYKVLWTRVSTILLAILSVQRTRTFFSLSYRETRLCACSACIFSIIIALTITCLEWTGVRYKQVDNPNIFLEIFQLILNKNSSREFYSTVLHRNYSESMQLYPCLIESFSVTSFPVMTNQVNCSSDGIRSEFTNMTKSLLSNRDPVTAETDMNTFINIISDNFNLSDYPILTQDGRIAQSSDFFIKLFYTRSCQIPISYSLWLKTYDFLNSLSLKVNRRALAIFFGNALPSFIVVLANLLSIKVIYFSNSLKYLKQTSSGNNRRQRRLQNDLHAFLVILIESFSIIMISWGIPIFLTMYHCLTLYVISVSACPKIKDYLILFLFTDLFNSATNCLLYSISGKLFRRRLIGILKTIIVCGRGTLWDIKQRSSLLRNQPLNQQLSNNPSTNTNHNHHFHTQLSKQRNNRHSERLTSPIITHSNRKITSSIKITTATIYNRTNGKNRQMSDDISFSVDRTSDDQYGRNNSLSEMESDATKISKEVQPRKRSQSIGLCLLGKVRSLGTTNNANSICRPSKKLTVNKLKIKSKKKLFNSTTSKQKTTTPDLSLSLSSFSGSASYDSQQKYSLNKRYSLSKVLITNKIDSPLIIKNGIHENLTSL